jgi:hypothetical protein
MTYIAWWRRLTRRGYARHPLFGFAGKRGLKIYYWFFYKILIFSVQAPLSTAGEERVAQRSVGRVSLSLRSTYYLFNPKTISVKQCKLLKTIFDLNVLYSALSYICASIIN